MEFISLFLRGIKNEADGGFGPNALAVITGDSSSFTQAGLTLKGSNIHYVDRILFVEA
ncbi:MAG: hypothetical protein J6Y28_07830 [Acholeplasmatales bacterium]|nr:hypothetical protein [Acholeplasmatales bacterium]